MHRNLLLLIVVTLQALFSVSCDGSSPTSIDLGIPTEDLAGPQPDLSSSSADLSPSPDLTTCGVCACGITIYRASSGSYPAVAGSGAIVSDTCLTGVMGSQLETQRLLKNDSMGNITVSSADGSIIIGTGPVRCNTGTLTSGPTVISDGICRFTANYKVTFTLTADNAFDIMTTQSRSNTTSEPGQNCQQPLSCAITYKVSHKM